MSAETLRRAASLIRERAEAAKGDRPEWFVDKNGYDETELWARRGEWDYAPQPVIDEHSLRKTPGSFDHFAALTPAVALAVAEWLDDLANRITLSRQLRHEDEERKALAVARAYLGESA